MAKAYETYASAQRIATELHNRYRAMLRRHGDDAPETAKALTKATEAALYRADAKAQYRAAKLAAQQRHPAGKGRA